MATKEAIVKIREQLIPQVEIFEFEDVGEEIHGKARYVIEDNVINEITYRAKKDGTILEGYRFFFQMLTKHTV